MSQETLELLLRRRSAKAAMLGEPGPTPAQLETILTAAARVPDHKKLEPWRFVVFEGDARAAFGRVLLKACLAEDKETPSAARLETEQILSCGAACFNMCLAANALGFATCWITEWYSYSQAVRAGLGLAANERMAGFVYIGTAKELQPDRERPQLAKIVTRWTGQ
jgi:nitroreductase